MDPDPAIFVTDLQDANKKLYFCSSFEGTFTYFFFTDKKAQKSLNSRNHGVIISA
jgi:hypothetical protein